MEEKDITIYRNVRINENDFTADIVCNFCSEKYNSQVLKLPFTKKWICKSCLTDAVRLLDENMRKNFQPDFEASRKSLDEYEGWEDEGP
jgi:hypothetical protein